MHQEISTTGPDFTKLTELASELDQNSEIIWQTILPQTKLKADHEHNFKSEIINKGPFSHVRLSIFPDGGISRMRLFGRIVKNVGL